MFAVVLDGHQRAAGQGLVEPEQAVGQLLHFGQGAAFNSEQKLLFPVPGHHDRDRFCLGAGLVYGAAGGTAHRLGIQREVYTRKMELLDFARKKTTQKVNLYEKVQIPGYEAAILKIRRFLEDEENLSKSAQKIVKSKHEQSQQEAV